MRYRALIVAAIASGIFASAQSNSSPAATVSVPHVIRYTGSVPLSVPAGQTEHRVRFRLFTNVKGGSPLWQETQNLTSEAGKINALIGSISPDGIPEIWFTSGQARWLEVQVGEEPPLPRVRLASVPYALKAANADTLGGRPLSAFVLRNSTGPVRYDTSGASYATLGGNSFVGDQNVNGNINVTGYVNTALETVSTPLVVNQLLWVHATATTGGVIAVKAENASVSGTGIMGIVTSPTGNTVGVIGRSDSVVGNGVYGVTTSATGSAEAISGTAMATQGHGVGGYAIATTGASVGVFGKSYSSSGTGVVGEVSPSAPGITTYGVVGKAHSYPGVGVYAIADANSGNNIGIQGVVLSPTGTAGVFNNISSGNILIGQAAAKNVFRVDGTGKVYANNGYQSSGADFAESIRVAGQRTSYEPGDVLVLDPDHDRQVTLAAEPYSTLVAGVYSTKPGTLSTMHEPDAPEFADEVPVAVIGIVPCKVTTINGVIHRGDLLVTSPVAGYAMKGTEQSRMAGAVVGKAMQELRDGSGVIAILVSLQ